MFTRAYLCLQCLLVHVYLFNHVYSCLPMFMPVYLRLQLFAHVYLCLPLFSFVYLVLVPRTKNSTVTNVFQLEN